MSRIVLLALFLGASAEPLKLGSVAVTGSIRTRTEMWNWFQGDANNSYAFQGSIFKLGFAKSAKTYDWNIEFAAPVLLGLPDDAIAPGAQGQLSLGATYFAATGRRRHAGMLFPKQGFVKLKGLFGDDRQSLRIGRFEFSDASEITPKNSSLATIKAGRLAQRLIGPFGWSHTGRSFDGIHYAGNGKRVNLTFAGAMPTRGAFQVDGWNHLDVAFGYLSLNGQHNSKRNAGDWRLFGIYYHDWRNVLKTDNRPLALRNLDRSNIRIASYGGHYLHALETKAGAVDVLLFGILQNGRWGRIDHRAGAFDVELGYQPKGFLPRLKPWFRTGHYRGSGDNDPNDNRHGTFFQLLPTPRPFARTPFFDMVNNEDTMVSLLLRPHKNVKVGGEFHNLMLSNRNDLWILGGGAFQPWTFGYIGRASNGGRGLANLYDVSLDWTINPHYAFTAYLGRAQGKDVVQRIYPKGSNGTFAYLELMYKF